MFVFKYIFRNFTRNFTCCLSLHTVTKICKPNRNLAKTALTNVTQVMMDYGEKLHKPAPGLWCYFLCILDHSRFLLS